VSTRLMIILVSSYSVVIIGDNGTMAFWDWKSGYKFQALETTVQPGSLESEAGIFACTFDRTGLRLITCEADKTIKIWREDPNAVRYCGFMHWKCIFEITKWYFLPILCINFVDPGNTSNKLETVACPHAILTLLCIETVHMFI